jgi:hypothetical protein
MWAETIKMNSERLNSGLDWTEKQKAIFLSQNIEQIEEYLKSMDEVTNPPQLINKNWKINSADFFPLSPNKKAIEKLFITLWLDDQFSKWVEIPVIVEKIREYSLEKKWVIDNARKQTDVVNIDTLRTTSERLLTNSNLNFEESLKLAASVLNVPAVYNETFTSKLKKKQAELWLESDRILGSNTLFTLIKNNNDIESLILLTTDQELVAFNNDIKSKTVTVDKLQKIQDKILNFMKSENIVNILISQKLYDNFKDSDEWKDPKFNSVYNNELKINKLAAQIVINKANLGGANLETTTLPDWTVVPAAASPNIIKTFLDPNKTLSEKLVALSWSALGWFWIILLVWKKFWFTWIALWIGGLIAGASDWITPKSLAKMLGEQLEWGLSDDTKAAWAALVASTSTTVKDWATTIAEKLWIATDTVVESFATKNSSIETTMLAENPKLNKAKIALIKDISVDTEFKKVKIDDITKSNFSNLSTETREKLEKAWIIEKDKEFIEYLKILKYKIVSQNSTITDPTKKINTVWEYFESGIDIDWSDVWLAAWIGFMAWGLLSKSPLKFFLWAGIVTESTTHFVQNYFTTWEGKKYVENAKNITEKFSHRIDAKMGTLKFSKEIRESINKFLSSKEPDFKWILDLAWDDTELEKKLTVFKEYTEENYYTSLVETKTWVNSYIPDFIKDVYKSWEELITEQTDSFDKNKVAIEKTLDWLTAIKTKIESTNVPTKALLIAKIDAEIAKSHAQIALIEAQKEKSKIKDYEELKEEISELEKEKTKLEEENKELNSTDVNENVIIQENNIKIIELENQIKTKTTELALASIIVSKTEKEKIEKPENILKIEQSIKKIEAIPKDTTLLILILISNTWLLSQKNLDSIKEGIATIKELTKYTWNDGKIKKLILEWNKQITELYKKIKGISEVIIKKVDSGKLNEYPQTEIKNYQNILKELDIKSDFEKDLKAKKETVFKWVITNASIEDIQILRENFGDVNLSSEGIEERLKELAEVTLVSASVEILKIIKSIKDEDIEDDWFTVEELKKEKISKLYYKIFNTSNPEIKRIREKIKSIYNLKDPEIKKDVTQIIVDNSNKTVVSSPKVVQPKVKKFIPTLWEFN